jgi:kynurenine formamidase
VTILLDWHHRGGLVARGVLIDYRHWADNNGIIYSPFEDKRITIKEIEKVANDQRVDFRQGDIFIIRTGFTEALSQMNAKQQEEALGTHKTCGVEGTEASASWFWNKHFAAVAGDSIAFEATPPITEDGKKGGIGDLGRYFATLIMVPLLTIRGVLHQYFLALFGLPIGELWDLKALSEHCAATGRYTFLLTSSPLNVPGSIGSPPNALAIF